MSQPGGEYLKRKEAAMLLRVSERTIDRMIREGRIKGFKPPGGRRVLISRQSINEYIERGMM
jgi:excisionase family DNA binding protein